VSELCDDVELAELRDKLAWRGPEDDGAGRFLSVFMDQNNRCNLRCRMCGFSDPRVESLDRYDMPRVLYERIASEAFPRARYVCLSIMTEPFMTADFPERLDAIRRHEVPFSDIITNGTILPSHAIACVVDAQITRVIVSIDGGTKAVYEDIRRGARFETVIANFQRLRAHRDACSSRLPVLRINHVLSERNIDTFPEFLELVEKLRPEEVAVRTVSRMSNAEIQETSDAVFWEKVRDARVLLREFCRRTGIIDSAFLRDRPSIIELFTESGEPLICRTPWTTLAIHPNGDVFPCMAWSRPSAGNLARQTLDEIWNGASMIALREEFARVKPGVDCLHCTIRRSADDLDDDFFYRKLSARLET